jgi:hypothetical protein
MKGNNIRAAQTKPSPRKRADTLLVFDPGQKIPKSVLDAIVKEWLTPALVERFLQERGITRQSLSTHYGTLSKI